MPHNIIMPALGMTQETGLIVAWHKQPGDAVKADDVLLEVETDKTTMEVEAGREGFVANVFAEAGAEIPVGEVIAVLSETKPDGLADRPAGEPETAPEPTPAPVPSSDLQPPPEAQAEPRPTPPRPPLADGRILASPKAKRLARERGLDLERLVALGVPQPFHVADLDALTASAAGPAGGARSELTAAIPDTGMAAFLAWLSQETGEAVDPPAVWAAFAAASLRAAGVVKASLAIRVETSSLDDHGTVFDVVGHSGLTDLRPAESPAVPDLIVRDLTATRLIAVRLANDPAPVLAIAHSAGAAAYQITLDFAPDALPVATATALIDSFAMRIETPICHLL